MEMADEPSPDIRSDQGNQIGGLARNIEEQKILEAPELQVDSNLNFVPPL